VPTFSFRPSLTLKGRKFKGLRGWAGKPFHPPLTDVPIGAYVLALGFDVVSFLFRNENWSHDLYRAGTFAFVGGAIVSLAAMLTGWWDWLKSTKKGTQARRTVNAHAWTMIVMSVIVFVTIWLRTTRWDTDAYTGWAALILSAVIGLLALIGGTIGGGLTYDYGFNVETSGDHPVWHESDVDVMPGQH